ncbi:hypothetical protein MMPV_000789 [Pyropia vietnamensis]
MGWASTLEVAASTHGLAATVAAAYAVVSILLVVAAVVDQTPYTATTTGAAIGWALPVARAGGALVHLNGTLLLLSGCRVALSVATPVAVALPVDRVLPGGHMAVAAAAATAAAVHVAGHAVNLATGGCAPPGRTGTMVLVSGGVLVAIVISLWFVTLKWVRMHRREVFAVGHGVLSLAAVVLLSIHGMHRGVPSSIKWLAPSLAVYALDLIVRQRRTHTAVLSVRTDTDPTSDAADSEPAPPTSSRLYGNVLCLALPRPFQYKAGQSVLLRVPAVSRHQWHPFTIASAPADPVLRLYIKDAGDWTSALLTLWRSTAAATVAADGQNLDGGSITVQLQGPYGAPTQHAAAYDRLVLIGAGIGATPFVSVVQHFAATMKGKGCATTAAATTTTPTAPLPHSPASPAAGAAASGDPVDEGAKLAEGRVWAGEATAAVDPSATVAPVASAAPFPGAVAIDISSTSTVTAESATDGDSRSGGDKATAAVMAMSPSDPRPPVQLPRPPMGAMRRGEHPSASSTSPSLPFPPADGVADGALARTSTAAWAAASARGSCANLGVSLDGFPTNVSLPSSASVASPRTTVGSRTPPAVVRAHIVATSAAVGVATLWAAGGRLALLAAAAISGEVNISEASLALYNSTAWVAADMVVAAVVAAVVLGGLAIEAAAGAAWTPTVTGTGTHPRFTAARVGRWVECFAGPLLLLHPLVAASVTFALGGPATSRVPASATVIHLAVLHPAAAVIAAAHVARVAGRALLGGRRRRRRSRMSLSAGLSSHGGESSDGGGTRRILATRPREDAATVGVAPPLSSLDFVWVVRRPDDDAWLRAELGSVAATPGRVRLHRWVTQPSSRTSALASSPVPPPSLRPAGSAEAGRSGAAVGVFCCGPPAVATAVRAATAAAAAASAAAAVKYGALRPYPGGGVGEEGARAAGRVAPAYGCGVRLTFRQERFA